MSKIYVLTLKEYDYYEFTSVVSASTNLDNLLDLAAELYPELLVYVEDSAIYAEHKGNLVCTETPHLTMLAFDKG